VIGGLIGLLILAAVLLLVFFDPNDYRGEIERIVETRTGRELTLEGDLSLSIFPWLAVEVGRAQLGDSPAYSKEPFVSIDRAKLGVRLLPLLSGRFEVGSIELDAPRIRLITTAQGNNWDDLGESHAPSEPEPAGSSSRSLTIAGLAIRDGDLNYEDRAAGSTLHISDLDLDTGRLGGGEPFDFEAQFHVEQDSGDFVADVQLNAEVTLADDMSSIELEAPAVNATLRGPTYGEAGMPVQLHAESAAVVPDPGRYALVKPEIRLALKGEGFPADGVKTQIAAARIAADTAAQTASVEELVLDAAGARVTGSLSGTSIVDAPKFSGAIALEPVSLRKLLPQFGVELPVTADENALESVGFKGRLAVTADTAALDELALALDQTTATGRLGMADFERQAIRFDLDLDRIDLDRYLPPETDDKGKDEQDAPTEIPVDLLRSLDVAGELRIREAVLSGMALKGVKLGLTARDGKVRLNPSEAALFGGRYQGDIRVDARQDVPSVSMNERISNVDFAALFGALFETSRVAGKGNATAQVKGAGRTTDALLGNLSGDVAFDVADGALEGVDLWYEIRRARALLDKQSMPAREGPARTPFTSLRGTGVVTNGVLANNDLEAALDYLRVTGKGTVNLPQRTLDYSLKATVLKLPAEGTAAAAGGSADLVRAEIPVSVTGSLSDPKVRPDVEAYLKGRAQQAIEEHSDEIEKKLKDKLGDKLKGILGGDR
jgi:AsmA protein